MAKCNVLIVEDDESLRKSLEEKLTHEGFEVVSVVNGNEAFDAAKTYKPQLILLDIILPTKSGWEVLQNLKGNDTTKSIPVLIISNFGSETSKEQAANAGAEDFILKSNVGLGDLVSKVKEKLSRK
ncbi:response regulator [Candidatus Saccharibacteria bacterium CPR2]|nr:response regulator [Candidatus Saccharibacteria bacterium CPR2]